MTKRLAAIAVASVLAGSTAVTGGVAGAAQAGWTQQNPIATNLDSNNLQGVSCPTATRCVAVGYGTAGTGQTGSDLLAETWTSGTAWSAQPTPEPGVVNTFSGVSCPSAALCTAVGATGASSSDTHVLIERLAGGAWTVQTSPEPSGAVDSSLGSVSCPSTTVCVAVGSYTDAEGTTHGLAERWANGHWTLQKLPGSSSAVSCTATNSCFALGGGGLEHWGGTKWTVIPAPIAELTDLSCPTANECMVVSNTTTSTRNLESIQRLNGHWSKPQTIPQTYYGRLNGARMDGVSCASTTACTAVGNFENNQGNKAPDAFQWTDGRWRLTLNLNNYYLDANFYGVSCSAPLACTAVGGTDSLSTIAWRYS